MGAFNQEIYRYWFSISIFYTLEKSTVHASMEYADKKYMDKNTEDTLYQKGINIVIILLQKCKGY